VRQFFHGYQQIVAPESKSFGASDIRNMKRGCARPDISPYGPVAVVIFYFPYIDVKSVLDYPVSFMYSVVDNIARFFLKGKFVAAAPETPRREYEIRASEIMFPQTVSIYF